MKDRVYFLFGDKRTPQLKFREITETMTRDNVSSKKVFSVSFEEDYLPKFIKILQNLQKDKI